MKERSYGSFRRAISLYSEAETEKVVAHVKKDVLTVSLPKSAEEIEGFKKINVKVE